MMDLPRMVTTDQGKEFNNSLNRKFMKKLNIMHNLAILKYNDIKWLLVKTVYNNNYSLNV